MKKRKHISLLLICVMVMGLLVGCGNQTKKTDESESKENETTAKSYTVTDILGREVEVPTKVEKIVTLGSAARMVTYAGAADKIVGLSDLEMTANCSMPFAYVNSEKFNNCTGVSSGGSGDTFYTEEIATLAPDLIIMLGAEAEAMDELQSQLGIPVVGIYADNFYDQKFYDSLTLIGEIMGTKEHAEKVVTSVKSWVKDLNDRTKDIPEEEKPTVYTGALGFRGAHGFEGTAANFPPFVAINAKNVVDETGESGTLLIDLEKVAVWNPDIIFLNPSSMNLVNEDYAVNATFYDNLDSVKNNKVYSMVSFNYFWTNMELAIADAYYAGSIIYPEQFADVDFEKKADEIFNVMLGCDYLKTLENAGIGFGTLTIGE